MMKQSTSFAQVATNLLNVLQGYTRGIRLLLVIFLTLTVTTNAWGADAEFAPANFSGQGTSGTGSEISATVSGVTFACDKGYGTTQFRCDGKSTITISSSNTITAISFTFSGSYTGGLETSYTNLNTNSWEHTLSSQARITACVVTYEEASADPHTVTFNAGSGTCDDESLTETSGGAGVTLPTANPPAACATDGWKFAGWWTEAVAETTTSPSELLTAGSNYKPTEDCTLHAVYSYTEAGGGGSDVTFNFSNIATTNSWTNGTAYTTVTISPITINAIGGGNNGKYYTSDKTWRMYNGGSLTITTSTGNITNVSSDPSCTFTITNGTATCTFSETTKFKSITVTSGGGSTTYYHSNPECTTEPSVTLNPNGGDFDPKPNGWTQEGENYKKEGVTGAITLPTPTRTGYDFKGWYDAASGGTEIADGGEDYTPSEDIVLYAQWDPITYIITLNLGTGTCDNDKISGTYSNGVVLPTASPSDICAEEGWTFAGWAKTSIIEETTTSPDPLYVAGSTYNPVENIILYAVYVKQTFTLSLVDNSTTYYVGKYESSQSILTAETDVNNAMDFRIVDGQYLRCESGYISHNSASSTNISCYLSKDGNVFPWTITENTGTISFQSTKAVGNVRYLGYNYNRGNPRFAVYVEGYAHNFTKTTTTTYTTDPNCCTQLAEITGLTFSAMTRSITVSVPDSYDNTNVDGYIFNLYNAATGGVATTYDTNDKNEKSHTFTGLNPNTAYHFTIIAKGEGDYCNSAETSPRESHTTLPQYTVTWNPAGGNWSGSTADKVDTYDYQAEITKPADPERKGYTFNGWNTTLATTMPAENLTYTAQWNIVTYTITYENLNGATHTNPEEYTVETAAITLTDPTERAGYVFAGWYSDAECTTEVTEIPNGSTGNITLYAKWLNIYTITWKANGLEYETTKVTEGDPIIPPSSPDLGDYCGQVFAGWTDAELAETTNVAPTLYPNPTPFPTASEESPTTFYAVFADYDEQQ